MENEFGHIVKKKVENSSLVPPPMDWNALSDAQNNTDSSSKRAHKFIKPRNTISIIVAVSIISAIVSFFVFTALEEKNNHLESNPDINDNVTDSLPLESTDNVEMNTVSTPKNVEKEFISVENKPLKPQNIKKKKHSFKLQSRNKKLEGDKNKKTESTTTIHYEVDTITTETYIYE